MNKEYGTSGDPTKYINVESWPISHYVTVWFQDSLTGPTSFWSGDYNASGFRTLHILVRAWELTNAETSTLYVYGILWRADHMALYQLTAYEYTLASSTSEMDMHLNVPSEILNIKYMLQQEPLAGHT